MDEALKEEKQEKRFVCVHIEVTKSINKLLKDKAKMEGVPVASLVKILVNAYARGEIKTNYTHEK